MAEVINMPHLSDTMTEGVVSTWHKKVGDTVKSGEILADIETDKATMEFESYYDGVLLHVAVEEGKAHFDVGAAEHSPDHALYAYALDEQGSEYYAINIKDLATGQVLADGPKSTTGDFVFSPEATRSM